MYFALTPAACRAARALLKWSTRDLARESGVAFTTINRIEAGAEPRAATAQKIQAAFARFGVRLVAPPETGAVLGTAPSGPPPQEAAERLLDLTIRLFRASRAADREEIGLGGLQLSTMTTIQLNSGISLTALAGAERVAHPTMSRLIGSLIRAGMVEKSPDPADRRV
jgi:transcriptional regulator with XRE-family HTH domain